jgi:hypothetical protein
VGQARNWARSWRCAGSFFPSQIVHHLTTGLVVRQPQAWADNPMPEVKAQMIWELISRPMLGGLHHDYQWLADERPSYPRAACRIGSLGEDRAQCIALGQALPGKAFGQAFRRRAIMWQLHATCIFIR